MRLDFFIKLKYESSTIIKSVGDEPIEPIAGFTGAYFLLNTNLSLAKKNNADYPTQRAPILYSGGPA